MQPRLAWRLVRMALTALHLMAGWLLFTWSLDPHALAMGAVYSTLIALAAYGLFIDETEVARRALVPRIGLLAAYAATILWQIYAGSFRVALMVVTGRIRPRIVHFRTRLSSDVARVALANSITLTPGTVTLELDEDHLVVHWLDAPTTHARHAWSLIAEPFERWLKRIWI